MFSTCCGCPNLRKISLIMNGSRQAQMKILKDVAHPSRQTIEVSRSYVTKSSALNDMNVFDENTKTHHKNIAAQSVNHHVYDYLRMEVMVIFYYF